MKGGAILDAEEESAPQLMASSSGSRSVGGSIPSKPGKELKTLVGGCSLTWTIRFSEMAKYLSDSEENGWTGVEFI